MKKQKKSGKKKSARLYWILLENQVTQFMADFLKLIGERLSDLNIEYKILPDDRTALQFASPLHPSRFTMGITKSPRSAENVIRKRNALGGATYTDGLPVWRALVLDDLGGASGLDTELGLEIDEDLKGIVVQVPSPIGSTPIIEHMFRKLSSMAKNAGIPLIGCEFFPLNLPWTLSPSLLDGLITIRESSYDHLSKILPNVWLLPRYEAPFFFMDCPLFWRKGLGAAYKYGDLHSIPRETTILYIPHTVAMIYEYRKILQQLAGMGKDLHIMFAIGEDQARGTYTHREIVEKVCADILPRFRSHSFHDLNDVPEMGMADALIAACPGGSSAFASTYGIPALFINNDITAGTYGNEKFLRTFEEMDAELKKIIHAHKKTEQLARILSGLPACARDLSRTQSKRETGEKSGKVLAR